MHFVQKIIARPYLSLKGWKDYRRGWSDRREQAPVIPGPNKRSAEGTKDHLVALTGLPYVGYPSPGANTPVCNLLAPSGLYRNLWNPWNLCALIRTSIRAIRAECGEVTHSASPSTHRYPYNPDYPWSANPFSSLSSFRLFSELKPYFECCRCAQNLTK